MIKRLAGLLAVALMAACGGASHAAGNPVLASALRLSFTPGETITYDVHLTSNMISGTFPIETDVSGVEVFKVLSVAADGTATIQISASGLHGTANGKALPSLPQVQPIQMQIAADGRVTSGSLPSLGAFGAGQLTPLLPPNKVRPGDKWTRDVTRPNPFGSGSITVHAVNQFLRYDTVGGVKYAVVTTTAKVPLNVTMDFAKLASLFGSTAAQMPAGTATITGSIDSKTTSSIDPATGNLYQMLNANTMDMTVTLSGSPQPVNVTGTQSLNLIRR